MRQALLTFQPETKKIIFAHARNDADLIVARRFLTSCVFTALLAGPYVGESDLYVLPPALLTAARSIHLYIPTYENQCLICL